MKTHTLAAAIAAAAMLGTTSAALPSSITAGEFVARVVAEITAGDIGAARADLLALRDHGFPYLRIGTMRRDVDTLIDLLRGRDRPDVVLAWLTAAGVARFEPCEPGHFRSAVNLEAPPVDMFPVGSAGCEV